MRKMRDSGIEWVGAIPAAWGVHRIASHFQEIKEKNTANAYSNALQFKMGKIIAKPQKWDEDETNETYSAYTVVHPNTIMINGLNLEFDFVTQRVARVECNGIITSAYIALSPRDDINAEYICYLLKSYDACRAFHSMGRGLRKILSYSELKNKPIVVPPLAEQERIAAFLDAECAEIDAVLEKTRASIEEYKKLKQAVITQAVTKGIRGDRPMKDSGIEWIGDIPAEWKVASIGRFCFVTKLAGFEFTNDMMSNIQDSGDIPIVRAQNIKMGKFINNISEFIPYRISQKLERCALNRKCLIITFIGAGIGEVAIFNEPKRYHLAPNVAKIVINVGMEHFVTEEYLLYFLMSFAGQEEINKIKKATAQPSLSMGTIRSIKMVLPDSIEEQSEIVSYLDMRCDSIDALIAKKQQYLIEIENYKKSLIYEYVTGKKEVHPL